MLECQEYLEARQKQCVERMCMKPSQATISDLDFMLWYKEALQDQEVCDNSSATCPKDVSSRLASNEEIQDFLYKDHLLDEKIKAGTVVSKKTKSKSTKKHAEGRWTKDEDTKLRAAVKEMSGKNWKRISELAFTGVRSDVQCLHRWQKVLRPGLHKGPWSKEEDAIVLEVVNRSGGVNSVKWSAVANQVKGRLGKQVRERWYNHLDPMLKKGPWAPQEDVLLLQLQAKMGNRWCEIAKNITGRSENAVKNRWNSAQRRARAQKENKNKDGSGTTSKKPRKSKKRKAPKDSTQTATSGSDGDSSKTKSKKRARTNKGGNNSNNPNGLSVISDIGTALQMCDMVTANSNSPVQSPTRPATPPTRKNETAAHVLAHSFVRISKEDDAASALLDLL